MGQIIDPEGRVCEQTKWHSRQKHAFLEAYLDIWSEKVGKDGKSMPTLDIFDLYASFGWCHCSDKKETWKGSALLAAECLKKYQNGRLLFLNSYSPDGEENREQKNALEKSIDNLQLPERIKRKISNLTIEKAVDAAIVQVNPNFPSLWILDPYQPEHLPWNIIEKICALKGSYRVKDKLITRRPELFICLMTGRLQRLAGMNSLEEDVVGQTLGLEKNEWQAKLNELLISGKNYREALVIIFAQKLSKFYGKPPIILDVPSTDGNIVYTVLLCTDHNAGHYVMKIHKFQEYLEWREKEWKWDAETISKKKKQRHKAEMSGQKQIFLDELEEDTKNG